MMSSILAVIAGAGGSGGGGGPTPASGVTLTYISGAYDATGTAPTTLNLDATPEGSYLLVGAGQNNTNTYSAEPTGVTNWQNLFRAAEGSFDGATVSYFEVASGAGITSIDVDADWSFRIGWALYKVTGFDPDLNNWTATPVNNTVTGNTQDVPADTPVLFWGTNRDHPDTSSTEPGGDFTITSPDFVGDNGDFYSYAFAENFSSADPSFLARVADTSQPSRDLAIDMRFDPPPVASDDGLAHTRWRIFCLDGDTANFFSIAEIEMRTTLGGSDVTSGETVIFGAERSSFPASEAFDNISGDGSDNAWSVDRAVGINHLCWVGIQFASATRIAEVVLTSRDDGFFSHTPRSFKVEYSDDGVTWYTVETVTSDPVWSQNESRTYNGW